MTAAPETTSDTTSGAAPDTAPDASEAEAVLDDGAGTDPRSTADGVSWPLRRPPPFAWYEFVAIGLLVVGFVAIGLHAIMLDSPMGHDESLYSSRAREMRLGEPRSVWIADYRAPGLSVALALSPLGVGDSRHRVVILGFGVLAILATWILARTVVNVPAGLVAAGLLALTPNQLLVSTLSYPDVPGAAVGVATMAVLAWALTRPRLPWWAWTIVPLGMVTTWIRYGGPMVLAVGLCTLVLFAWPRVRDQLAHVAALGVVTAAASGAILLLPALSGSDAAPLTAIRVFGAQKVKVFTRTLGDFWELTTPVLGTPLRVTIVVTAIIVVVALLLRAPRLGWDRGGVWALAAAVLTVAALSRSLSHGEGRYLAPVLPLLWIGLAAVLVRIGRRVHPVVAGLAIAALVAFSVPAIEARTHDVHGSLQASYDLLREAGRDIREDPRLPCPVVTSYTPQLEWYSECDTTGFGEPVVPDAASGGAATLVVVQRGKRQPDAELLDPVVEAGDVVKIYDNGGDQRADRVTLVRLPPTVTTP